jgi:hypothetical protein
MRLCLTAASSASWANSVLIAARSICGKSLPAWAWALRTKCALDRIGRAKHLCGCHFDSFVGVGNNELYAAQNKPDEAAQKLGPERLGLAWSDFRPYHLAPAIGIDYEINFIAVHGTIRLPSRALTEVALIHRYGRAPSNRRLRNAPKRLSIATHEIKTCLLEISLMPAALTRSATERTETPCS